VNVLLSRLLGIGRKLRQVCRSLVVEFDKDHRTLNTVIEGAVVLSAPNPTEPCVVDVTVNLVHLYPGMSVVHVTNVEVDQIA
jgi:hypothetical protein